MEISISQILIVLPGLFLIAFIFSMFGRGGGEFILPFLISVIALPYYDLATISLFLILSQGIVMLLVYGTKHKLVDWPLAFSLAGIVAVFAFFGGYLSLHIKPVYLKVTFAVVLLISAWKIYQGKKVPAKPGKFGVWHRKIADYEYDMNFLYIVLPVGIIAFVAGMLGISGCGLIIPITIILGGVPIRVAIGSNTLLVIASSGTSFMGHLVRQADTNWPAMLIFAIATVAGALFGSRTHANIPEIWVTRGFIAILIIAALWMVAKIYI